jgi:hypothetical protein
MHGSIYLQARIKFGAIVFYNFKYIFYVNPHKIPIGSEPFSIT